MDYSNLSNRKIDIHISKDLWMAKNFFFIDVLEARICG